MRKQILILSAALALVGFLGVQKYLGAKESDEKKSRYSIKQVMKLAHNQKSGLLKKVVNDMATKGEKGKLLELYIALSKDKPPKGSSEDWKKRTAAMVKAARAVVADKEGAATQLKKAVTCMACHEKHRPAEDDD